MPTVSIGTTSKRINSTSKIFTGGANLSCKLKEPCSMQSPVFLVQGLTKGTFYNYCSFENKYYWIDDIVYQTNDIQEVHCSLDALATYADAIKDTSAWVKYADAAHWNKNIDDLRMQLEKQDELGTPTIKKLFNVPFNATTGTIILRIMSCMSGSSRQGVKTVAMTVNQFNDCLTDLTGFADNIFHGVTGALTDIIQRWAKIWAAIGGQGSWRDNILSCIYMPIATSFYAGIGSLEHDIALGSVPCGGDFYYLQNISIMPNSGSLSIPWTTNAQTYPFLKNARWTAFQVTAPGGYQDIDPTDLRDQQSCGFFSALNVCTGEWSAKITEGYIDSGQTLASFSGCMGVDMLGFVGTAGNWADTFVHGAGMAIRAALGDASVVTQIGESHTTSSTATETKNKNGSTNYTVKDEDTTTPIYHEEGSGISGSFLPSGISVGSASGGYGGGATNMFLFNSTDPGSLIFRNIQYIPEDLAHYTDYCNKYGYPCNKYLQLSSITGYCCCVGASVSAATGATAAAKSTINSYLNSGIYIEA